MRHFHIDTDMGVDDGLALLLAHRLLPGLATLTTVFGNVPVQVATQNALIFRHLLGHDTDWMVLTGASCATDGFFRDARHVHGADGMGGATATLDAGLLARTAATPPRHLADAPPPASANVTLIGLGPATNIPVLAGWYGHGAVERIVLMSGAFFDDGNITPHAEFNAHCDPNALRATLALGIPTTLVPADVCRKVQLPRATMAAFGNASQAALPRLLAGSHMAYMDFYQSAEAIDGCVPYDSVAVLAALEPDRFYRLSGTVSVDSAPHTRGRTRFAAGPSHVDIVTGGRLKWVRQSIADALRVDAGF